MTRRLKWRIDPEQSPYTCMLPEHKPVRRGREMIDLLAVGVSRFHLPNVKKQATQEPTSADTWCTLHVMGPEYRFGKPQVL
jgi:hypothetical protein